MHTKKEADDATGWFKSTSNSKMAPLLLPPCDPYEPRWKDSIEEDEMDFEDWKKMVATHSKKKP
jgi:hypothetical protein